MDFDGQNYQYPSRRSVIYSQKGMVATSQPLAAQAGLDMLKKGGNAVDAAIAAAAALTVLEPASNGIGGDAFALIWIKNKLHGLDASGYAPQSLSIDALTSLGYKEIPKHGMVPITVPGAPSAWALCIEKFGRLSLPEVLAPAIAYAREGYPLQPVLAANWKAAWENFKKYRHKEEWKPWFKTFAPEGRAPGTGEVWRSQDHADTLEEIAATNGESFYRGNLAGKIDAFSQKHGGFLRKADLEEYRPRWVEPIGINYRGYDVWEIPPHGHGIVALMGLNILKNFEFPQDSRDSVDTLHKQIEALKLAYIDGKKYIADANFMRVSVEELLSESYAKKRSLLIGKEALEPEPGRPQGSSTVYLAAADGEGNMVSFIQSNYMGFGSGMVVEGTGIGLHNRACNFSFDPGHANALEPRKKPYHTIIPGFMTKQGKPAGPFGVMGGFMQPQGHLQMVMNTVDFLMNPQDALDSPRWQWIEGKKVWVEPSFPNTGALERKGHHVLMQTSGSKFGRGQIIWRVGRGTLAGGTEPRTDGHIAAW